MDIYQIGSLEINLPRKGVNRAAYATEFKNDKLQFTKAADKAKIEEDKKSTKLLIPITNVAFATNGQTPSTFESWIKTIVWDRIGSSNKNSYKVTPYQEMRSLFSRK